MTVQITAPGVRAGRGTAVEANARYRQLIANGATWLSVTFDLPTRLGHDSDAPAAAGEVGRDGVAVDSIDDMRVLFGGIPLGDVSTSMTVGAPAAPLLLLYHLVAEEQGVAADRLTGALRHGRAGQHPRAAAPLFPPRAFLRLNADVLAYCRAELPRWGTAAPQGPGDDAPAGPAPRRSAPGAGLRQGERLAKLRAWRCGDRVDAALTALRTTAAGPDNVLHPMKTALSAGATLGEVCSVLREVWGTG